MEPEIVKQFQAWESFYVILGSSAGALTGLQFVVVALVVDVRKTTTLQETSTFSTPTVIHFTMALLVSALLSAPWPNATAPTLALGAFGAGGLVYATITVIRTKRQTSYKPVFEDWLWFNILPIVAYAAFLVSALALRHNPTVVLFIIAASVLLLVLIGIHNAWDTVTFVAAGHLPPRAPAKTTTTQSTTT